MNYLQKTYLFACLAFAFASCGEQQIKNVEAKERTIEVRGSADMSITPDEIELSMEIQAYGAEKLEQIQAKLMAKLAEHGVRPEDVKTADIGDYWHYPFSHSQLRKDLKVKIKNLAAIEQIVSTANIQGLNFIRISDMRHSQLQDYRKQVKSNALKAAKMKAEYLLETMGKTLGDVISIKESQEQDANNYPYYWWYGRNTPAQQLSNVSAWSGQQQNSDNGALRDIVLRYEMEVVFGIEN